MSRRNLNQSDSDSLKEEQAKKSAAVGAATSAETRVAEAGAALGDVLQRTETAQKNLDSLEETEASKKADIAIVDAELVSKRSELRSEQGAVAQILTEVGEANDLLVKAKDEHSKVLGLIKNEHQTQMAAYEKTQSSLRGTVAETEKTLESKKNEVKGIEAVISRFKAEEGRLEKDVLPALAKGRKELDSLNHDLLVKQVAVKEAAEKLAEMVGKYNSEKVKYDEAMALRIGEEQIIAKNMQVLVDKEAQVENKMRTMRTVQVGMDQHSARLKRQEEDIELGKQLLKTAVIKT